MAAAFAPKPTTVSVEAAKIENWPPQLTAIGTLRAYQGIIDRAAGGGQHLRHPSRIRAATSRPATS